MSIIEEKQKQKYSPEDKKNTEPADNKPREIGGPKGPEPTRYGDWERRGRCIDF